MVTKQQLDAMGKILPVQGMEVCGAEGTPCISVRSITNGLKISSESILDRLLPDINYSIMDGETWVTVESLNYRPPIRYSRVNLGIPLDVCRSSP